MITYNPEIKAIIEENGGKVVYSSGNIIVATDISIELARQLSHYGDYIENITTLPLKPIKTNYTTIDLTNVTAVSNQTGGGTVNPTTGGGS